MSNLILNESGKTKGTGKRRRAKLIAADVWGSSAYYPADVLERDAAEVFTPGVKMYENHLTESEEWERPEGDVSKLVGKLTSYGMFEPDNPEGPGVYADVEFYDSYVPRINEIGGDVGLSIKGSGDYVEGEIDGRFGKVITKLMNVQSVDVVTTAGAGGKLVSILESARPPAGRPIETEGEQSVAELTKEDFEAALTSLKESIASTLTDSIGTLTTTLKESLAPAEAEVEETETSETDAAEAEGEKEEQAEVDHVALATAVAEAQLPAAVIPNVVTAVQGGATIEDAVKAQTALREAFAAQAVPGSVRIVESEKQTQTTDLRSQVLAQFK